MNTEDFAPALGRIPSGLFILTARLGDVGTGMLVSFVQQCSFDPPQVSVAVKPHRSVADWLTVGVPFVLNILGEDQRKLLTHFAKGFEAGKPAFQGLDTIATAEGVPVLTEAFAHLECRVSARAPAGDHDLVIGLVVGGRLRGHGGPYIHVRKSGLNY